jgi:transcriptional regulator with XRE-family HTH domain
MTLQELSDAAGVSVGYISQIERDQVTPTLGTLALVAESLGVGLDYFVSMPRVSDLLVRREDRRRFSLDGVTQQYEQVGADLPNHEMSAFVIHVPDGYRSETVSHDGEEFIHVLAGRIEMALGDELFTMGEGDSLHYRGNRRHSWSNLSGTTAQLLWVGRLTCFPRTGARPKNLPLDMIAPGSADARQRPQTKRQETSTGEKR